LVLGQLGKSARSAGRFWHEIAAGKVAQVHLFLGIGGTVLGTGLLLVASQDGSQPDLSGQPNVPFVGGRTCLRKSILAADGPLDVGDAAEIMIKVVDVKWAGDGPADADN
jgi:hypothetical protein